MFDKDLLKQISNIIYNELHRFEPDVDTYEEGYNDAIDDVVILLDRMEKK